MSRKRPGKTDVVSSCSLAATLITKCEGVI